MCGTGTAPASDRLARPIAMAGTARLGGIPALSAAVSIVTVAIGGAVGRELPRLSGRRAATADERHAPNEILTIRETDCPSAAIDAGGGSLRADILPPWRRCAALHPGGLVLASLRRWRPVHLLAAWAVYWLALLVVAVVPPLLAFLRMPPGPGDHRSVNLGFGDGVFTLTLKYFDRVMWDGSIHFLSLALLVAVPPLVLFAAWLTARRRERAAAAPLGV